MQFAEGGPFRAHVALAPNVLRVRSDFGHLPGLDFHMQATHRFTQRTRFRTNFGLRRHAFSPTESVTQSVSWLLLFRETAPYAPQS